MTTTPLLSPERAWRQLVEHLEPLAVDRVRRRDAWRRVLAEDLLATVDVPAENVSAMDGYAVGPTSRISVLPVSATVAAGDPPGQRLAPGSAARIMTGAPVPDEVDRVIPIEQTDGGLETVVVEVDTTSGSHIRRRGEVLRAGDPLLASGTEISAAVLANLATHGFSEVAVHRPPTVAVVTTGDEVVAPESRPRPGQLRDSHTDFLLAAGRELGLEFESLGIASDEPERLADRLRLGLEADVLLIGGGVSKGAFDWVGQTLEECGCETLWHGVAIQPGKPLLAARHPRGIVFGLPGNPNSVMATYTLFVRPALRRLQGFDDGFWSGARSGVLEAALPEGGGLDRFLPARVRFADGEAQILPLSVAGSHDMVAFAGADGLVRASAGVPATRAGERCRWIPLPR